MKDRGYIGAVLVTVIALAGVLIGIVSVWNSYYSTDEHHACVVTDKDRTKDRNGNSDARVYTDNCGTFQVKDSWVKGKTRSADTFGSIKVGKTYDFTTIGWRNGFFSLFPNILEATEVK